MSDMAHGGGARGGGASGGAPPGGASGGGGGRTAGREPDRTGRYGDHPAQVVDEYGDVHATGPHVAVLHGGYWRERYDRGYLAPCARAWADLGMRVSLIEYRRVGGGGGWPATAEDVDAALDHLGAPPTVLLGHSAGGQLALWAAAKRERAAGRVLAVAPVADLARAHELRLSDGAVAELLGGDAAVDGRLPEADPMRLLPRVPVEIVHGTGDEDVPLDLSRRYANNWGARLHLLPGVDHFAPLTPGTPSFGVVTEALHQAR